MEVKAVTTLGEFLLQQDRGELLGYWKGLCAGYPVCSLCKNSCSRTLIMCTFSWMCITLQ